MNTSEIPVTPIKQTMVNIAGNDVLGVLLEGGQVAASLRMMCDLLGVDYMGQMRKIRANRAIYDSLILAKVETAGGAQETNVIIAEAIPIWLAHIYENKVSPEARETLIEFQRVAVQTLRAFFFPEIREQPKQSAPPKPEPEHIAPPKEEPAAQPFPPPPPRSPDVDEFAYWEWVVAGFTGLEGHIREMADLLKQTRAEPMQTAQQLEQHDVDGPPAAERRERQAAGALGGGVVDLRLGVREHPDQRRAGQVFPAQHHVEVDGPIAEVG
jgi:hypothetical protein